MVSVCRYISERSCIVIKHLSSAPHKPHSWHRHMEQEWLRNRGIHLQVFSGGSRGKSAMITHSVWL